MRVLRTVQVVDAGLSSVFVFFTGSSEAFDITLRRLCLFENQCFCMTPLFGRATVLQFVPLDHHKSNGFLLLAVFLVQQFYNSWHLTFKNQCLLTTFISGRATVLQFVALDLHKPMESGDFQEAAGSTCSGDLVLTFGTPETPLLKFHNFLK